MLVALGAALFVVVVIAHGQDGDVGRAIQGVAAGIGFIGAGTILKEAQTQRVTGLTTAASIWMTAAVGVSAGAGSVWLSIVATLVAWIILNIFPKLERRGPPGAS
jgi:putative Mg2+ transporter-C (MgtC) family protein